MLIIFINLSFSIFGHNFSPFFIDVKTQNLFYYTHLHENYKNRLMFKIKRAINMVKIV